jgi:heptosyltransferase-2
MNIPNEPRRILIIQTAFLGDIVLTIPLLKALKKYKPDIELFFLTTPVGKSLLEDQHIIDKIIVYDKKGVDKGIKALLDKVKEVRTYNIDTVISPHRSFRSGIIALFSGAGNRIGYSLPHLTPFYNVQVNRDKGIHEIDRILSLLKPFNIELSEEERYPSLETKDAIRNDKLVGIAPGSTWGTKQWTEDGYAALIRQLHEKGYGIVLIGSNNDKMVADKIKAIAGVKVNDMVGKTDLKKLIKLLSSLRLLVTNDNGAMQVAQAVNTPITAIFGPTVPEQGFAPIRPNTVVIESKGLYCRPCSAHGPMECPEGHFLCMKSITPEAVFKAVEKMLGGDA